jgi:hypothetical protein
MLCSITFFVESRAVFENVRNIVESGRAQMTLWRMRITCWIPKFTNTHSEFLVLLLFHYNSCTNAPQCYVIDTLRVLFNSSMIAAF